MATFERRGDYWRVKVRRTGFPAQTRTFDNKALAERWAREVENDMDRGDFVDRSEAEKNTLGAVLDRYRREITPSKKGADSEAYRIQGLLGAQVCAIKMSALSSAALAAFRDERLATVSASTVNRELNVISHAIEIARREWGIYLPENPVRLVRRPKMPRARERRFEPGEEARLLAACRDARNPQLLPIVQLAIETGMRQSELVGLERSRIDLRKRVAVLPDTKNGEARSVPLSERAVAVIRALPTPINSPRLFPRLSTEAVKRAYIRACKRAGIENLHFHDLRHEATSRLFEMGLNPMEVAAITGHKTLQMLKRYTHLNAADLARKLR